MPTLEFLTDDDRPLLVHPSALISLEKLNDSDDYPLCKLTLAHPHTKPFTVQGYFKVLAARINKCLQSRST